MGGWGGWGVSAPEKQRVGFDKENKGGRSLLAPQDIKCPHGIGWPHGRPSTGSTRRCCGVSRRAPRCLTAPARCSTGMAHVAQAARPPSYSGPHSSAAAEPGFSARALAGTGCLSRPGRCSGKKLRFLSSRRGKPRRRDAGALPAVSVGGSGSGKQAAESAGEERPRCRPGMSGCTAACRHPGRAPAPRCRLWHRAMLPGRSCAVRGTGGWNKTKARPVLCVRVTEALSPAGTARVR